MRDLLPLFLIGAGLIFFGSRANASVNYREGYGLSTTVGQRNNNPLNIRYNEANNWLGQDASKSGPFVYFVDKKYGYRAAFKLMANYAKKYGADTIEKIVSRWAPTFENPTENYIQFVVNRTGIPRDKKVYATDYPAIIKAMAHFESSDNDAAALADGYALAFGGSPYA